jgi:hypothetical protein
MGAEDDACAFGDLVQFVHEDRPEGPQFRYDVEVVNDLFANVDRRPEKIQCDLHNVNGAYHAGAETSWG